MRAIKAVVLATAATLALAAAPASAGPHWHGGGHGGHWGGHGGGWGYHGGWGGGWGGPALVFGLAGAAIAAGVAADACVRYVPVYDAFGNVVGRRAVNAC